MNKNKYAIVYDFETTSADPYNTYPLQIAAQCVNLVDFTILPKSEFQSYCRPPILDAPGTLEYDKMVDDIEKSSRVHGITLDKVLESPPLKMVWSEFCKYIKKYNTKKSQWTAPISSGYNIRSFDNIITDRMCYEMMISEYNDERKCNKLFSNFITLDLMDIIFLFHENNLKMDNIKLSNVLKYHGIDPEGAHNAMFDVEQCCKLLCRYMHYIRRCASVAKFEGAFREC